MSDRKLKLFTPIYSDPVGWSRWIGNSLLFVLLWFIFNLVLTYFGFQMIYHKLIQIGIENNVVVDAITIAIIPIGIAGVLLPTMNAYAIYRLLKIIDGK